MSDYLISFKVCKTDGLESLAREDLELDASEGGILRITGRRHNGVMITIPFQLLMDR
jgi:hypothetical protein